MKTPQVLLLGRANVGKSTLFNRLSKQPGQIAAIESKDAGTTRNLKKQLITWTGKSFVLIDSAGWDIKEQTSPDLATKIKNTLEETIKTTDLIVFVIDSQIGFTETDKQLTTILRKQKKPVILVANKADSPFNRKNIQSEIEIGFKWKIALSAKNGSNTGDLLDLIINQLPPTKIEDNHEIKLAIIGKPNVGKSSILNRILQTERSLTDSRAHTTRDPVSETIKFQDLHFKIIDTAGLRHQPQRQSLLEKWSFFRSQQVLSQSELTLLVLDLSQPLTKQDARLGNLIEKSGNSLIIIANKWDLIKQKSATSINQLETDIYRYFPHLTWAPIIFSSCLENKIHLGPQQLKFKYQTTDFTSLLKVAAHLHKVRHFKIGSPELKDWRENLKHLPSRGKGFKQPKLMKIIQSKTNPPTFKLKLNRFSFLHRSYFKYLENQLRTQFDFSGTPIKIDLN